uniref:Uncharacterized protein n=1 Tax=Glossina palpalis gambiensis TaxID=67801 RepID=A0A1B0C4B5_9MUSC
MLTSQLLRFTLRLILNARKRSKFRSKHKIDSYKEISNMPISPKADGNAVQEILKAITKLGLSQRRTNYDLLHPSRVMASNFIDYYHLYDGNLIPNFKYLRPAFPKAEVHEAFHQAYDIFCASMTQHMRTVVAQLGFFKQGGSCGSGSIHPINLLGYSLFMLLKGTNWRKTLHVNISQSKNVPDWRLLLDNARERKLLYEITTDCIYDMQANVTEKIKLKKPLQDTNSN